MSEKKRKMIDVDPAVVEMFARVLQKLKPPPKLTISEWADRFRQMSPEASAGTGRWHTDNAPYQREIMDAIGNPHVRMVVFKSSSQVGKTEVLLNVLGYYIDYNPPPPTIPRLRSWCCSRQWRWGRPFPKTALRP